MRHSQKWPLSRKANKSKGECSVCHAVRQLHLGAGTVHRHGPRDNPCPGSDKPPVPCTIHQPSATPPDSISSHNVASVSLSSSTTAVNSAVRFMHPVLARRTIKHIPKSARPACAKRYAELLRHCINEPQNLQTWEKLLTFGRDVLTQPERGGKRHNLTSIIKKRTAEPFTCNNTETSNYRPKKLDAATILANAVSAKITRQHQSSCPNYLHRR